VKDESGKEAEETGRGVISHNLLATKPNVNLTLSRVMKAQKRSRCITAPFFNSALGRGGWSTSRPGLFTPAKNPGTPFTVKTV
jgi:hypothetical protein